MSSVLAKNTCDKADLKAAVFVHGDGLTAYQYLSRYQPHTLEFMLDPAKTLAGDAQEMSRVAIETGAILGVATETDGPLAGQPTFVTDPATWRVIYPEV